MIVEIPTNADFDWYSLTAAMDGVDYRLVCHWNTRDERWYLTVVDADGETLVAGIPLVVDYPLLSRFTIDGLPPGVLMALDTTGEGMEPEHDDLGDRVRLIYIPQGDL